MESRGVPSRTTVLVAVCMHLGWPECGGGGILKSAEIEALLSFARVQQMMASLVLVEYSF